MRHPMLRRLLAVVALVVGIGAAGSAVASASVTGSPDQQQTVQPADWRW